MGNFFRLPSVPFRWTFAESLLRRCTAIGWEENDMAFCRANSAIALAIAALFAATVLHRRRRISLKVYFTTGSAQVQPDQRTILDQAARLFRDGNPIVMVVSGGADTVGSPDRNLSLSLERARAVADGPAARGIPAERLQVLGPRQQRARGRDCRRRCRAGQSGRRNHLAMTGPVSRRPPSRSPWSRQPRGSHRAGSGAEAFARERLSGGAAPSGRRRHVRGRWTPSYSSAFF